MNESFKLLFTSDIEDQWIDKTTQVLFTEDSDEQLKSMLNVTEDKNHLDKQISPHH